MIVPVIMDIPANLVERLRRCATLWTSANGATPARLGRLVVNDGGFFARIDAPSASVTTATLEKFATYLQSPDNWGEADVPIEVQDFFERVFGTPPAQQDEAA